MWKSDTKISEPNLKKYVIEIHDGLANPTFHWLEEIEGEYLPA